MGIEPGSAWKTTVRMRLTPRRGQSWENDKSRVMSRSLDQTMPAAQTTSEKLIYEATHSHCLAQFEKILNYL